MENKKPKKKNKRYTLIKGPDVIKALSDAMSQFTKTNGKYEKARHFDIKKIDAANDVVSEWLKIAPLAPGAERALNTLNKMVDEALG